MTSHQQALSESVARYGTVVLSLPCRGGMRHHRTRFLGQSKEGLWIAPVSGRQPAVDAFLGGERWVAISFRHEQRRVSLAVRLLRRQPRPDIEGLAPGATVEALLVSRPEEPAPDPTADPAEGPGRASGQESRAPQRRAAHRLKVHPESRLQARIWRIPEHVRLQDRPMATLEMRIDLVDLSTGGIGAMFHPPEGGPLRLILGQRLRIELVYESTTLLVEGRLRYGRGVPGTPVPDAAEPRRAGIQFSGMDDTIQGRQRRNGLTRLVAALQREEVRRSKMDAVAA